jgi:hypothetical protein
MLLVASCAEGVLQAHLAVPTPVQEHIPCSYLKPTVAYNIQCCQMAEISAKSSKGAGENLGWPEEFVAELYQKWQKRGGEYFIKKVPYLTELTHFQRQRKI